MYGTLKKRKVKSLFIFALGVLIITAFSGCSLFPSAKAVSAPILVKPPVSQYKTEEVKKGNIAKTLTCTGNFVSNAQKDVSFTNHGGIIASIRVQQGDDVKKGDVLATLDTASMNFDLQKAEIELQKAQVEYQMEVDAKSDANKLKLAQLDVQECQLEVDETQDELRKSTLTAPVSGKVFYIANINAGDIVQAFHTLISIGDESQILIECSGNNLDSFRIGMKAQIKYKDDLLTGQVVTVPSSAPDSKGHLMIRLDKIPSNVSLGDGVDVSVILEKKNDVIVIPADKVNDFGGKYYVSVLENGNKVDKLVETGIKTDTEVEITKGLNVGDKYIVGS